MSKIDLLDCLFLLLYFELRNCIYSYIVIASEAKQSMIMRDKLWIATSEYRLAKTENDSFVIQRN